jgi:aryl-alcohol dehydrogenase-like predicted oxidoreductase
MPGAEAVRTTPREIAVGTWAWGNSRTWGYGHRFDDEDLEIAFEACVASGLTLFDTAEIYGSGRSERILGACMAEHDVRVRVGTKFMPYPWRLSTRQLESALGRSLDRLGIDSVALYQLHRPLPPIQVRTWASRMAGLVAAGLVKAVGVCNCSVAQLRSVTDALAAEGLPLATCQVQYSLLDRRPERSGVRRFCHERGIPLVAASPLCSGVLSGGYGSASPPEDRRARVFTPAFFRQVEPLLDILRRTARARADGSPTQVALAWLLAKGAIPLAGVTSARQADDNAAALNLRLSSDEIALLDRLSGVWLDARA